MCNPKINSHHVVTRILEPSGTPAMFDKQVEEHHLSFQNLITLPVPIVQEV